MKFKLVALSLLTICLLSSYNFHPLNMSVGDITYNDKKFNLKFKFFVDNLQNIITKRCGYVDMETEGYSLKTEKCLQQYITSRFEMSVNNQPTKWTYVKGTLNRDVLVIEYQSPYKQINVRSIKIKNTLLFDADLPEMKNIMNVHLFNKIKVLEFDNNEAVLTGKYIQEITYK